TNIANGIISKVGTNGEVCIYAYQATHLIIDVNGYFPATADYNPLNPARLLDSRSPAPAIPPAAAHSLLLLNQLRASYGAGPLVYDAGMSASALNWSAEMSLSGFRHSGAGFAENIAWHSLSSMSPTTAAATLHNMWVGSPGHLKNMVNKSYTRVGIGIHQTGSGWYGTHMFS
ncbi:MAG: CAP domain-containing protein, partial [Acidimicrobiia bacterium]|nr:CAP domain-containing protein [Acidimicrobiia bacterium]